MTNIRTIFEPSAALTLRAIVLLCIAAILIGCFGWARTREYVPSGDKKVELVAGWYVEPNIYAYKDVTGINEPFWDFFHHLWFSRSFGRGKHYADTVSVAEVDTLEIRFPELDTTIVLSIHDTRHYVSNRSDDSLIYAVIYEPNFGRDAAYPVGPHQAVLKMRVRLYPGVHRYIAGPPSDGYDSVTVDRTRMLRDTVIEVPLRFHESKFPAVHYGD